MQTYSSYTYDSANPVKRALHRNRYQNILRGLDLRSSSRVLDYGCGDGRLFRVMIDERGVDPAGLVAFDPVPAMREEFRRLVPEVRFFAESRAIPPPPSTDADAHAAFDFIFCCEVLEHLTPAETEFTLGEFRRLSGPATVFVIEVPIEIGPTGLAKNLYRRLVSGVEIPTSLMLRALVGGSTVRKPRTTPSGVETFEHPGYSYRETRRHLAREIDIGHERNDPFRWLPFLFNNSRIFVGQRRRDLCGQ